MNRSKESTKAAKYLNLLYDSRCRNQFNDFQTLARKTEKHAPSRKCLVLSAQIDATLNTKPGAQAYQQADKQYSESLANALPTCNEAKDILDGEVALAVVQFGVGNPAKALGWVSEPLQQRLKLPTSGQGQECWPAVSVVRGSLIRGLCFEAQGNETGAATTYRSVIAYLAHVLSLSPLCPALRQVTEELLVHMCLFFATETSQRSNQPGEAMATFHLLSQMMEAQSGKLLVQRGQFTQNTPHKFWAIYYAALTDIVREGLVYHPSPLERDHDTIEHRGLLEDEEYFEARQRQVTEIRKCERNYESILLESSQFPKAGESSTEIQRWVELVMQNWRVMSGPTWTQKELGPGGSKAIGRNALDILYRAATKTFHSTQILRHLFTLHAFLGEFDLAFKAFDSYIEILTRGKSRYQKTGTVDIELDEDETAVRLVAEGIRVMARYGSADAAKKCYEAAQLLHKWAKSSDAEPIVNGTQHGTTLETNANTPPKPFMHLSKDALALCYRAIGISQANWSRYTFNSSQREDLQQKAVWSFEKSLTLKNSDEDSIETLFALSLLLAELRRIPEAVGFVRRALRAPLHDTVLSSPDGVLAQNESGRTAPPYGPEKLLPLHHLLALLLSASEDYDGAQKACQEATSLLPYIQDLVLGGGKRNSADSSIKQTTDIGMFEKQALLETELTHASLMGITEGSQAAIRACNNIVAVYSRLFGNVELNLNKELPALPSQSPPPTSRSTKKWSMIGRPKSFRRSMFFDENAKQQGGGGGDFTNFTSARTSRPVTRGSVTPSIKVTGDATADGVPSKRPKSMPNGLAEGSRTPKRVPSQKLKPIEPVQEETPAIRIEKSPTDEQAGANEKEQVEEAEKTGGYAAEDNSNEVARYAHNMPREKAPPPPGHDDEPPKQDTRLPTSHPDDLDSNASQRPHIDGLIEQRHKASLLVKLWLYVARAYVTVKLFADARQAIQEARDLVESLEARIAQEESSVRNFQSHAWGCGKSLEELWADVYCEAGNLLSAQGRQHDAIENYERSLAHHTDHTEATIGLSNILIDIYRQDVPYERPDQGLLSLATFAPETSRTQPPFGVEANPSGPQQLNGQLVNGNASPSSRELLERTAPPTLELYRLAARDRAYGLLSSLTKLGSGWDSSEAWLSLARAYEESGQVGKAKEALWWTLELEDTKPVRHWINVGPGGYVL